MYPGDRVYPVTTTLCTRDEARFRQAAEDAGEPRSVWLRKLILAELDRLEITVEVTCSACGHEQAEHSTDGCSHEDCRCWKFQR